MRKQLLIISTIVMMVLISFTEVKAEKYAVVAVTRNQYAPNYSLNIQVDGNCISSNCVIFGVTVWNGSYWESVMYNKVYNSNDLYSVIVRGTVYYFEF